MASVDLPDPREHPFDPDGRKAIDSKADDLIKFVTKTFENRQEKRLFKREHPELIHWWQRKVLASLATTCDRLRSDQVVKLASAATTEEEDAAKEKIEEYKQLAEQITKLQEQKADEAVEVARLSREFRVAIDRRIRALQGEQKGRTRKYRKPQKVAKRILLRRLKDLKSLNAKNLTACYPLRPKPREDDPARQARVTAMNEFKTLLGVELGREVEDPIASEGEPAENSLLEAQSNFQAYEDYLQICPSEIEHFRRLRRMPRTLNRVWKFADKIDKWYDTLYATAREARMFTSIKFTQLKLKRVEGEMGSKEISIEFGASVEKLFELGLSVVLTASMSTDDDRSVVVHMSLQLVMSAEFKVGGTPVTFGPDSKEIIKFGAQAGFTIADRSYVFVDERHFAYYVSFKLANLLILGEHFTEYKKKAYNQYVELYDERLKKTLEKILEKNKSGATMKGLQFYLSESSVIYSRMAHLDRWKPEFAGTAKENVLGFGLELKGAPKRRFVYWRERLEVHKNGKDQYSLVKEEKTGFETEKSVKVTLPLFLLSKIDLMYTVGESGGNPRLRLIGDYKRFRLGLGILSHGLEFIEKDPGKLPANAQAVSDTWKKYVWRPGDEVVTGWQTELGLDLNLLKVMEEWYYGESLDQRDKEHVVRFSRRHIKSRDIQASLKVPVYDPIKLKVGFSAASEVVIREILATTSLAYLRRIHGGLTARFDPDVQKLKQEKKPVKWNDWEEWSDFVARHRTEIWKIFQRAAGNASYGGKKNKLLLSDMSFLEQRFKDYKHLLEDGERMPELKLRQDCKNANWKQTKTKKAFDKKNAFVEADDAESFDKLMKTLHELFDRVKEIDDCQDGTWKRKRTYLLPQKGTLTVHLHWDGKRYIVEEAPILKGLSLGELWTLPQLRQATDLLPFYLSNMQLVLYLHSDSDSVKFSCRHPDGNNNLEFLVEKLCAAAVARLKKKDARTASLEALLRLDPDLWKTFEPWLAEVQSGEARKSKTKRHQLNEKWAALLDEWSGKGDRKHFENILSELKGPYLAFASSREVKWFSFKLDLSLPEGEQCYACVGRPLMGSPKVKRFANRPEFRNATTAYPFATTPLPFAIRLKSENGIITVKGRLANGTRELKRMLDKLCGQLIQNYDAESSLKARIYNGKPRFKREQLRALVRIHERLFQNYEVFLQQLDDYQEGRRNEKGRIRSKTRDKSQEAQLERGAEQSWAGFIEAIEEDHGAGRIQSKDPYETILYSLQLPRV